MRRLPLVSVVIVTHNSAGCIVPCLRSLWRTTYPGLEILVVDNDSSDTTRRLITQWQGSEIQDRELTVTELKSKRVPPTHRRPARKRQLKLLPQAYNLGFAGGSNLGIAHASAELVLLLNPDTVVTADSIQPLVRSMERINTVAACQPSVYLLQQPDRLNLTGKETHYLGLDWVRDYQAPASRANYAATILTSVSGSGVLLRKDAFRLVGGFDEAYFMYYEDTDLSWRLRLAGFRLQYVPESRLYHHYRYRPEEDSPGLSFYDKLYWAERNRWLTILKNYRARTLLILLPMIVIWEVAMIVYATGSGWLGRKLAAYRAVIALRHQLVAARRQSAAIRVVSDRHILKRMVARVTFSEFQHPVVRWLINPLAAVYYQILLRVIA